MEYLCYAIVIYVTLDIAASAYVIHRRGGIKNTISDIRANLCYIRNEEDDDDVHDQW